MAELRKNIAHRRKLEIRKADLCDMYDLLQWRNHADVRKNFFNPNPVSYDEHEKWFHAKIKDPNSIIYVVCCREDKIGSIRFENIEDAIKVSVMLNPNFLGKGFGPEVIKSGMQKYLSEKRTDKPFIAEIKPNNIASIRAFQEAGFKESFVTYLFHL